MSTELTGLGYGRVAGPFEHANGISAHLQAGEFLKQLGEFIGFSRLTLFHGICWRNLLSDTGKKFSYNSNFNIPRITVCRNCLKI